MVRFILYICKLNDIMNLSPKFSFLQCSVVLNIWPIFLNWWVCIGHKNLTKLTLILDVESIVKFRQIFVPFRIYMYYLEIPRYCMNFWTAARLHTYQFFFEHKRLGINSCLLVLRMSCSSHLFSILKSAFTVLVNCCLLLKGKFGLD